MIQATLIIRPDKIVFGGSVSNETLLEKVRDNVKEFMNNDVEWPPLDKYITRPLIKNKGSVTLENFADLGIPSKRILNERSNELLRKDGLPKQMGFNEI